MFRHIFMANVRGGSGGAEIDELLAAWRALGDRITDVKALSAGRNVSVQDRTYSIVLVADFASREAWERYMQHPDHLAVRDSLSAKVLDPVSRVSAQYSF